MDSSGVRVRGARRTREALLRAAWQALATGRAATVGIAELTRNAGVATGSFYNHFEGREELFAATIAEVVSELARTLDDAVSCLEDPADVVRAQFRAFAEAGVSRPDFAAAMTAEGYRILGAAEIRRRLFAPIRAGVAASRFRIHDSGAVMDLVDGVVLAILRTSQRPPGAAGGWVDALARQVVALMEQATGPAGYAVSEDHAVCVERDGARHPLVGQGLDLLAGVAAKD
ncbi:TetR/AcrR family transcriptional regulator [Nocardia sp. KC 131]|uniref:TetR/AcrR family transcriptional regulator n=1 Tax=Nocardia arseniciresistens TaxID=3392119 RepID=UPI00398E88CD